MFKSFLERTNLFEKTYVKFINTFKPSNPMIRLIIKHVETNYPQKNTQNPLSRRFQLSIYCRVCHDESDVQVKLQDVGV